MKILLCIPSLSGGGAERQMSYLLCELAQFGIETHVAYLTKGPNPPDLMGVHMHCIKASSNYDPMILLGLYLKIREIKPDIIQSTVVQMDILACMASFFSRVPWIFREASNEIGSNDRGPKEKVRRIISFHASYIIANSQGGLDYWEKLRPKTGKIVIPNGIPNCLFTPPKKKDNNKQNPSPKHIIFIGRLESLKNISVLINAFCKADLPNDIKLIICGKGSREEYLKKLAADLKIGDKVVFPGYLNQKDLLKYMDEASLFVNPSSYEGCPNAVLEAMACSIPIAVSDIPAHREILNDDTANFFDINNLDSLVRILQKSQARSGVFLKKAHKSRIFAENFSVNNMANSFLEVYKKIILKKKNRSII